MFKDHSFKTKKAIQPELLLIKFLSTPEKRQKYLKFIAEEFQDINGTIDIKNRSLYTSFINEKFENPESSITIELLNKIASKAERRILFVQALLLRCIERLDFIKEEIEMSESNNSDMEIEISITNLIIDNSVSDSLRNYINDANK